MIDNNYVWGGGKRKKCISLRGSIPFHYMSGRGRGRNTLVCREIIICHRGVLGDKVIGRAGASPPSLTTGAPPSIYIFIADHVTYSQSRTWKVVM